MATISTLRKRLQALDIHQVSNDSLEETKEKIIEYNQGQLHEAGENKFQDQLPEYASFAYADMKHAMNPAPGFGIPDLRLTGAFYQGFKVDIKADTYLITSTDSKTEHLTERYGTEIFGLSDESRVEYVRKDLRPTLLEKVKQITGL